MKKRRPPVMVDEVVHAFRLVIQDDRFASVTSWAVPSIGWFKRVVHDQSKRAFIQETGVEHLSVAWLEHPQFLKFTWKENHGEDEQGKRFFVHVHQLSRGHLKMC